MAGRGPAPKDPARRVRHGGKGQPDWTVLQFESSEPPDLPDGHDWALQTRRWWEMWKLSPQSALFGQSDWYFLLDTALIHSEVWGGNTALAAELRLRVSKLGATVEDRLRLRVQFAEADEKDAKRPASSSARERYGDLRAVEAS